jgi:hypothetical protein
MRENKSVLRDVIETDQPEKESKGKKYVRIVLLFIFMGFFAILIISAILRRYGS